MKRLGIWLLLAVFLLSQTNPAGAQEEKFSAKVKVNVTADNLLSSDISSAVRKELRKLGDAVSVDEEYDYKISIVAMKTKTQVSQQTIGLAFSILITKPVAGYYICYLAGQRNADRVMSRKEAEEIESANEQILEALKGSVEVLSHYVFVGPQDDIDGMCRSIVSSFDTDVLEGDRKTHQKIQDFIKAKAKKPEPSSFE